MNKRIIIALLSILAVIFLTAQTCTTGLAAECTAEGDILCDDSDAYECGYNAYGYYVSRASEYDVEYCGATDTTTDTDEDGLTDYDEVNTYGTDPYVRDTDGDGALDGEEVVADYDALDATDTPSSMTGLPTRSSSSLSSDGDSDGLIDLEEITAHTDPDDADSDDDLLLDGAEVDRGTNPNLADTDSDGYDDGFEVRAGSDPLDAGSVPGLRDRDNDGMPDFFETMFGFDSLDATDAIEDFDGDGLTNHEEYLYETDPTNSDTDGDTYSDYDEINVYGTNPRNAADHPISMSVIPRTEEFRTFPMSTTTDTDDDSLPDVWEETYGFDSDNAGTASGDADGDGLTNLEEYEAGTDPTVAEGCGDVVLTIDDIGDAYTDSSLSNSADIVNIIENNKLTMTNALGVDGGHLSHTYIIDVDEGTRTSLDEFIIWHLQGYSHVYAVATKDVYDIGYDADDVTFDIEEDGDVVFRMSDAASMRFFVEIRENEHYLSDFTLTMNNLDIYLDYDLQAGDFDNTIFQRKDEAYVGGTIVGEITGGEDVASDIFSEFGDTRGPEYTMSGAIKIWYTDELTEISETLADHFVERVLDLSYASGQGFSTTDIGYVTLEEIQVSGDQVTFTLCDAS